MELFKMEYTTCFKCGQDYRLTRYICPYCFKIKYFRLIISTIWGLPGFVFFCYFFATNLKDVSLMEILFSAIVSLIFLIPLSAAIVTYINIILYKTGRLKPKPKHKPIKSKYKNDLLKPKPIKSNHIVIRVGGTLLNAWMGVSQLHMLGIGVNSITGIGALFGEEDNTLSVSKGTEDTKWIPLSKLTGRWILIIPEDAYLAFHGELSRYNLEDVIDGRVTPKPGEFSPLININMNAINRIENLLGK